MVALIEDDRAYPVLDQPVHELPGIGVQDPLEPGGVFPHQIPPDGPRPAPDSSPVGPAVPVGQFPDPAPGVRLGAAAGNEFVHPLFIGEISERILVGDHAEHLIGQRSEVTQLLRFFTDGRAGGVGAGGVGAGGVGAGGVGAGGVGAGGVGAGGVGAGGVGAGGVGAGGVGAGGVGAGGVGAGGVGAGGGELLGRIGPLVPDRGRRCQRE